MAPPKFDDLSKTAKDVLSEDYQEKGQGFKVKRKTNLEGVRDFIDCGDSGSKEGATLTTAVDFDFGGKCATPAKITWKFPKPVGFRELSVDKLELSKAGQIKLETSLQLSCPFYNWSAACPVPNWSLKPPEKGAPDTKVEFKSDLQSLDSLKLGFNYTGNPNAVYKAEIQATNPGKYEAEVSYSIGGGATVGLKSTPASMCDVGLRYVNGPAFFSAIAKDSFQAFSIHGYYKANDDVKVACNYNYGGKDDGKFSAGIAYAVAAGTLFKGKLNGKGGTNLSVSTSVKTEVAKGLTVTAGSNVPLDSGNWTWGMQVNVE